MDSAVQIFYELIEAYKVTPPDRLPLTGFLPPSTDSRRWCIHYPPEATRLDHL